jgi:hypothetical protein
MRSFSSTKNTTAMKTLLLLAGAGALLLSSCSLLQSDTAIVAEEQLDKTLVHFDIYIELLPDPNLNIDEQCQQAYELRLMSRGGYRITFYRLQHNADNPHAREAVMRTTTSGFEGNATVYDLPAGTYRVLATDNIGRVRETLLSPPAGEMTKLTFSFEIFKG